MYIDSEELEAEGYHGELANVIPHRYALSTDGRLTHGFGADGPGDGRGRPGLS